MLAIPAFKRAKATARSSRDSSSGSMMMRTHWFSRRSNCPTGFRTPRYLRHLLSENLPQSRAERLNV